MLIYSRPRSEIVINELNIIDPEKLERKEFIELKSTKERDKSLTLRGYKVIGLSAGEKETFIELVVTLWNEKVDESGFFTIGGDKVDNANMKLPNPSIKFRQNQKAGGGLSIANFLKNGQKRLNAVGLLYGFNNPFPKIKIEDNKQQFLKVNDEIKQILKDNLVDLVVYCKLCPFNKCNIYEEIYPEFANRKYALREFPSPIENDITLNRCTIESDGFLPEKIKLGKRTPNAENDCTGANFIVEDHIIDVTTSLVSDHIYSSDLARNDSATEPGCSSSIDTTEYFSISEPFVYQSIQKITRSTQTDACTSLQLYPDGADTAVTADRGNSRKRRISLDEDYSEDLEWETEKFFA